MIGVRDTLSTVLSIVIDIFKKNSSHCLYSILSLPKNYASFEVKFIHVTQSKIHYTEISNNFSPDALTITAAKNTKLIKLR